VLTLDLGRRQIEGNSKCSLLNSKIKLYGMSIKRNRISTGSLPLSTTGTVTAHAYCFIDWFALTARLCPKIYFMSFINPLSKKLYLSNLKTQFVPRRKHTVPRFLKTDNLMLYREKVAVCSEIQAKHINTLWYIMLSLKEIPLQSWRVTEGSGKLRILDCKT
jgi:hypothetical protein